MRATQLAHWHLRKNIQNGDICVDATLGNGHDALFLAELVGDDGHVHGFDVQELSLEISSKKLGAAGLQNRVTFHLCGHEKMAGVIADPLRAVMFNLGYLPGGDESLVTRCETTLEALNSAADLLLPNGYLSIVCYPGHAGGSEETLAVMNWAHEIKEAGWSIVEGKNELVSAKPFLLFLQKSA